MMRGVWGVAKPQRIFLLSVVSEQSKFHYILDPATRDTFQMSHFSVKKATNKKIKLMLSPKIFQVTQFIEIN